MKQCRQGCIHEEACMMYAENSDYWNNSEDCSAYKSTADVAPKSEVEELKGELAIAERHEKDARALFKDAVIQLQNARQEVAREIFEEIENVINNELKNNCKVLPQFEFSNELWNKVNGRIEALKEICDFIAALKKKYTEVKS